MSSYKKFLVALGALIGTAALLYGLSFLIAQPTRAPQQPEPAKDSVTVTGTIVCLPHKNSNGGPQTLECTTGLKDDNGEHYGLKNLHDPIDTNTMVEVTGTLSEPADDEIYDITSYINVEQIKETKQAN